MKKNLVYNSVKWISSFFILLTGLNSTYKWSNNLLQYDVHHSFSPKLTWPDNFTDIGTCFPPFPNTLKIWKWIPLLDKLLIYAPYKFQSSLCWWLRFQAIYLHEEKKCAKSVPSICSAGGSELCQNLWTNNSWGRGIEMFSGEWIEMYSTRGGGG